MKLVVLEFNKSANTSLDDFTNLLQKITNDNNDLYKFKASENTYSGNVRVEMLFTDEKTKSVEILGFGPALNSDVLEQLEAIISIAHEQDKHVRDAVIVSLSKSPRYIAFLVLEKGTIKGNIESAKKQKSKKRTED